MVLDPRRVFGALSGLVLGTMLGRVGRHPFDNDSRSETGPTLSGVLGRFFVWHIRGECCTPPHPASCFHKFTYSVMITMPLEPAPPAAVEAVFEAQAPAPPEP